MPIELICKGCSRKLRVGDEHAGKHARCPECGEINPISQQAAQAADGWNSGTPAASPFGATGQRNPFPDLPSAPPAPPSFSSPPRPPEPELTWQPPPTSAAANPFGDRPSVSLAGVSASGLRQQPHRGAVILVFAILGFFLCFIFSVLAWLWGAADLREMRRGAMDPSGMSLTQVGMILGIIGCALDALVFVMFLLLVVVGMAQG